MNTLKEFKTVGVNLQLEYEWGPCPVCEDHCVSRCRQHQGFPLSELGTKAWYYLPQQSQCWVSSAEQT